MNIQAVFTKAQHNQNDLFELLDIGRTKGFGNFINRKLIWPFLLQLDSNKIKQAPMFQWKGGMNRTSNDFEQLQKDADRSLSSMKTFEDITKFHLKKKQEAVLSVLDTFFAKNPDLKYIQGFHDVASIFLILFGNSTGYYLMEKAGRTYFYDFLYFEFGDVGRAISRIVYDIVVKVDSGFQKIYSSFQMTEYLIFIIPWILTWFAHNFSSVKTICRIWDYLFCTGPYGVFYFTAAILLTTKEELVQNCEQFDDPNIQTFYQQLIKNEGINVERTIEMAIKLESQAKIQESAGFMKLDQRSMFKYNNFVNKINIHREYLNHKRSMQKRRQAIKTVVKVGAVAITTAVLFLAVKNGGKIRSFIGGEL